MWAGSFSTCLQISVCAGLGAGVQRGLLYATKCCGILGTALQSKHVWVDPLAKPSGFRVFVCQSRRET